MERRISKEENAYLNDSGFSSIGHSKLPSFKLNLGKVVLEHLEQLRWFFDDVEELRVFNEIVFVNSESVKFINFRV